MTTLSSGHWVELSRGMQTFLPDPDFVVSAAALDDRRLGKQRVETLQVMRALTIPSYGWQHHPVVAMWRGYRPALMSYQEAICAEWVQRGFADTCRAKTLEALAATPADMRSFERGEFALPPWLGRQDVHQSHRSKLLAKAPEFYAERFPKDDDGLDYVWPVQQPPQPKDGVPLTNSPRTETSNA